MEAYDDPEVAAMISAVARFCLRYKCHQIPSWLSLLGKCGVGKTHCATRAWQHISNRSEWKRFGFISTPIYWPSFIQDLRSGVGYDKLIEIVDWPVLFLDDIGAERDNTGFAGEQLNALLGSRVGKWTILTSNLMLEQIASIDPRIADRIIREPGNQYVEVDTMSFGLRKSL